MRGFSGCRHAVGNVDFPAESNQHHLFLALNCPWCHRVTVARNILGLQRSITLDVLFPNRTSEEDPAGPDLWQFSPERAAASTGAPLQECTAETAAGQSYRLIRGIYAAEGSNERSVTILYDKQSRGIVSNESAEIIRMVNRWSAALGSSLSDAEQPNLYPCDAKLRAEIENWNDRIYNAINNGAHKAGFSSDQAIYEKEFKAYFDLFAVLDTALADGRPFLTGERCTEADLRLFPTFYRHDPI